MKLETPKRRLSDEQIDIEVRYKQTMEYPVIEVTWWWSLEDVRTIYFHEVDTAERVVEPVGDLLGRIPEDVVDALSDQGFTYANP